MKKITWKMWVYSTNFLLKAIFFNLALAFAIVSLIRINEGLSIWAIIAISSSSAWLLSVFNSHLLWWKMKKAERALWIAIRRHGNKIIKISSKEVQASGQRELYEIMEDTDVGLEVQMFVNGTGSIVHLFIAIKWFYFAIQFHGNEKEFNYMYSE